MRQIEHSMLQSVFCIQNMPSKCDHGFNKHTHTLLTQICIRYATVYFFFQWLSITRNRSLLQHIHTSQKSNSKQFVTSRPASFLTRFGDSGYVYIYMVRFPSIHETDRCGCQTMDFMGGSRVGVGVGVVRVGEPPEKNSNSFNSKSKITENRPRTPQLYLDPTYPLFWKIFLDSLMNFGGSWVP